MVLFVCVMLLMLFSGQTVKITGRGTLRTRRRSRRVWG